MFNLPLSSGMKEVMPFSGGNKWTLPNRHLVVDNEVDELFKDN